VCAAGFSRSKLNAKSNAGKTQQVYTISHGKQPQESNKDLIGVQCANQQAREHVTKHSAAVPQ